MSSDLYISEAAWKEYLTQDVFGTVHEFIAAMPPATKAVHTLPEDVGSRVKGFRRISTSKPFQNTLLHTYINDRTEEDWESLVPSQEREIRMLDVWGQIEEGVSKSGTPINPKVPTTHVMKAVEAVDYAYTKTALAWKGIIKGLNPSIVKSSKACTARLMSADPEKGRWTFEVLSDTAVDPHVVHIQGVKTGRAKSLSRVDLKVGCSCGFWRWQGPDYHAKQHGYLDQKARSDGSKPVQKDPQSSNRVCKHVYAASKHFLKFKLQ
tara:strand:- start:19797 stop:20591 length:795 start_codon:yes stop_codon:yes gene_type:complete